ncbi:variant leucine-rich repeat-containing protein [Cellulomonas hominis]
MTEHPDLAALRAADPTTPGEVLADLAYERPDLRPVVAANPAAYPGLLTWLAALGDPQVEAALAWRRAQEAHPAPAPAPEPWAAAPVAESWAPAPTPAPEPWGAAPVPAPQPAPSPWSSQPDGRWPAYASAPAPGQLGGTAPAPSWETQPGAVPIEWGTPGPARRSRRGLWIGLTAAVAVLVLGGVAAAYFLVLDKLGGAASPDAAVTGLLEGIGDKDSVAVYGMLSPAEITDFRTVSDALSDLTVADEQSAELRGVLTEAFDTVDVTLDGLEVSTEQVDDGLAKVSLTSGRLTVDGDPGLIADALVQTMAPLTESQGLDIAAARDQLAQELSDQLPYTVDVQDLRTTDGSGNSVDPFLMAVEEDGDWYVSPLMTLGEYAAVSEGIARGPMPDPADVTAFDTPEAAATGFAGALEAVSTGDVDALVAVLPESERRFVSVYGRALEEGGSEAAFTVEAADFTVRDSADGRAALIIANLVVRMTDPDGYAVTLHDDCYAAEPNSAAGTASAGCLSDIPLARELGVQDLALIAVQEPEGWHVSMLASAADSMGVIGRNLVRLEESGVLEDEGWWEQMLDVSGTSGAIWSPDYYGSSLEDYMSGDDFGDGSGDDGLGDDLGDLSGSAFTYGDDPVLDGLWDACSLGDMASCDELYWESSFDTDYEQFGGTCGGLLVADETVYGTCTQQY